MKIKSLKKRMLVLTLLVSGLFSSWGIYSGSYQYFSASFFVDPQTGNHTDSAGNIWYVPGFNYEAENNGKAKVYSSAALNRTMVLTQMQADNPRAHTCNLACSNITGANGQPMSCVDSVNSFPYLGNEGGKLFYPHAATRVSEFPGHGAHGGSYDIVCLGRSSRGDTPPSSTCSHTFGLDTITTCPQCSKNMTPNESIAGASNYADGIIVACAESAVVAPQDSESDSGSSNSGQGSDAPVIVARAPQFDSVEHEGAFVVEVSGSETGTSECARYNKVCVGGIYDNRAACLQFYPQANTANSTEGYPHDFFCKGGSDAQGEPCEGTLEDTCYSAVSSTNQYSCNDTVSENVDSVFVECEDPFVPERIEEIGGFLPPVSAPEFDPYSGTVEYSVTISHPQSRTTSVQIKYGTLDQSADEFQQATLIAIPGVEPGFADVSDGTADQSNEEDYQIGFDDVIDTDQFEEVGVNFVWDAQTDLDGQTGTYYLQITVQDSFGNTTTDISLPVVVAELLPGGDSSEEDQGATHGAADDENPDIDGDGINNPFDPDIDGDGLLNPLQPLGGGDDSDQTDQTSDDSDNDGDGIINSQDDTPNGIGSPEDIDGDGIVNEEDDDADGDGIPDSQDMDLDNDGIENHQDRDVDGDGIPNSSDADADGDGVMNEQDSSPYGRRTSDPSGSLFGGQLNNCFEENCTETEREQFFEEFIAQQQGGFLESSFPGIQQNMLEFLAYLQEKGYDLSELSRDSLSREMAVAMAGEILLLQGKITEEQIDDQNDQYYPDVDNSTRQKRLINVLTELEIINGFPDGKFKPDVSTNLVQGAKIIVNTGAKISLDSIRPVLDAFVEMSQVDDWFIPFVKTLDQLNIQLISEQVEGYDDYEGLGINMDVILYLLLFDNLSEVMGIDDVLAFDLATMFAG